MTPPVDDRPGGWPARTRDWARDNLFSSVGNTLLTLLVIALAVLLIPPFFRWAVLDATISGTTRAACGADGACWTFIRVRLLTFIFGRFPEGERWRIVVSFFLLLAFLYPVLTERHVRHRWIYALLLLTLCPAICGILLAGGLFGLPFVDTTLFGGLMLDVLIAFTTVAGALPIGILLAFGRRSQLPVVRMLATGYIELWRGVPLLSVLFMAAVLLPLFLPAGVSVDRLIRAMAALILFNAAYMAEVVRGGLQGVPGGQEEAGYSVGLSWLQVQGFVVLPQALRIVVPGIVNTVVDLFKDTTLVTIVGMSDLLGAVTQALKDPTWLGFAREGYVFSAVMFFLCCFVLSSYGRSVERRLAKG